MKLILCVTVIGVSLGIGAHLASRLTERARILGSYVTLLEEAALRMSCTCDDLAMLFADNFAGFSFVSDRPFDEQFRAMTRLFRDRLNADDISVLDDFTVGLGYGDLNAQIKHLRLYVALLNERLDTARRDVQQKGRLYLVLPASVGVAAAILLI